MGLCGRARAASPRPESPTTGFPWVVKRAGSARGIRRSRRAQKRTRTGSDQQANQQQHGGMVPGWRGFFFRILGLFGPGNGLASPGLHTKEACSRRCSCQPNNTSRGRQTWRRGRRSATGHLNCCMKLTNCIVHVCCWFLLVFFEGLQSGEANHFDVGHLICWGAGDIQPHE